MDDFVVETDQAIQFVMPRVSRDVALGFFMRAWKVTARHQTSVSALADDRAKTFGKRRGYTVAAYDRRLAPKR